MARVVRANEVFAGHFECQHCELDVPATVHAVGWGGDRPGVVGAMMNTQTPEDQAVEDAGGVASRTLQFVKCPRCGKYDPTGNSFRAQATIGALVIGAIAMGIAYWFLKARGDDSSLDGDDSWWAALLFGAVLWAVLHWKWSRAWRGAEKRTRIHYTGESS